MSMSNVEDESLQLHKEHRGKLEVVSKIPVTSKEDLAVVYTPGVAAVSKKIAEDPDAVYDYTIKQHTVAVVTDGSAVLGLGNIGPRAALPVMEGKALLLKNLGNIDAVPICLDTQDTDEIVRTVKYIAPGFGAILLEDIAAPRCFEIEERLQDIGIPVFHDDQHGTAVVVTAALYNAAKVIGKNIHDLRVVINGAGAAGVAVAELLLNEHAKETVKEIIMCDSKGIIYEGREGLDGKKPHMASKTNTEQRKGTLSDAIVGMDVFIGVSAPHVLSKEMIGTMAEQPIVFALANPTPEIDPAEAQEAGAAIVATGRSDYPNQVNNVLAFPGIFHGALAARAPRISEAMKIAATQALAELVSNPTEEHILPNPLDPAVASAVSSAVQKAA